MIETGTVLQNRYRIERQIGAGGMGAVYAAVDLRFESRVAIKETFYNEADLRDAFEREARLLNSLHHPVLPHVSDFFTEGDKHFLVMEFIEGEDLSEIVKREGEFQVADVLRWTLNLLDALDYLHSQNPPIIHRDIKPQNLKITPRGDIVLLDFGLAKLNSPTNTTNGKSLFGYSRKYSPLEQIQGTGTDARSDIFSLGATVYHLLTGKPPIDVLARAAAIIAGKPDPMPLASEFNTEVPLGIAQILHTALALNPELRFASAKDARTALEQVLETNADSNSAELPMELAAAVAPALEASNSVEPESFTALESFADAQNSPEIKAGKSPSVHISIQEALDQIEQNLPRISTAPPPETETRLRPQQNRMLLPVAAAAAILIWGGLAVWLVSGSVKSSSPEPQTTPLARQAPTPEPVKRQPEAAVEPESMPEVVAPEQITSDALPETKPSPKKIVRAAVATIDDTHQEIVEPATTSVMVKLPSRPQPRQPESKARPAVQQRNSQAKRSSDIDVRPRIVGQPPATGITNVINSVPVFNEPQRRTRRQKNQMPADEKEELRRRRMESVLRQNRQPNR